MKKSKMIKAPEIYYNFFGTTFNRLSKAIKIH